MRFSVGINYWPRSPGMEMWRRFDRGEIREDFARMASLGLDTVRFFLRWDDFQPQPHAVDPVMLDRLEAVVGIAAESKLRTMPTLFTGHMFGKNVLPAWARTGDLYGGKLLEAQLTQARAVGVRLRENPAIVAFDIGHMFSSVREPSRGKKRTGGHETEPAAERDVAEWSRRLARELKEASSLPATAGTHIGDITEDRNIRLASLCMPFVFASMQGSNVCSDFARSRLDPEVVPFLAMIAASFSFKPVMVTGFGNPTFDDPVFATRLSEDENATYCTNVLERLHADGRLGAYWWCWADAAGETYGIIRADGSERPVAAALSAFAREQRDVVSANDMPMIASEYYYRTLPSSTQTLYESFLGYVKERRS